MREIPKRVLVSMLALAIMFAAIDVQFWVQSWSLWPSGAWILVAYILATTGVEYFAIINILGLSPSSRGYFRFLLASGLLIIPLLAAFATLFATPLIGQGFVIVTLTSGIVVGFALIALLPAWPVAQALSSTIVPPIKVFKATHGIRWGLIGMALVLSAINRQDLIPSVDEANNLGEALAYAAGETVINVLSMVYTASIAATAFLFVVRNDETLYSSDEAQSA